MDLFPNHPTDNLLPCDGEVNYFGPVLEAADADALFQKLLTDLPWRHDETVMFGKRIVTARKVAWFGDAGFSYTYSGTTRRALPWTAELVDLKEQVSRLTGASYNSCLLNLYQDGSQGMGWHSDDEKSLKRDAAIASISLGAEREFRLKHKRLPLATAVRLEHGSLLVMKGPTQSHWLHAVPKTARIRQPRVNLTFRTMVADLPSARKGL